MAAAAQTAGISGFVFSQWQEVETSRPSLLMSLLKTKNLFLKPLFLLLNHFLSSLASPVYGPHSINLMTDLFKSQGAAAGAVLLLS